MNICKLLNQIIGQYHWDSLKFAALAIFIQRSLPEWLSSIGLQILKEEIELVYQLYTLVGISVKRNELKNSDNFDY